VKPFSTIARAPSSDATSRGFGWKVGDRAAAGHHLPAESGSLGVQHQRHHDAATDRQDAALFRYDYSRRTHDFQAMLVSIVKIADVQRST
jgi:hypothetical protein